MTKKYKPVKRKRKDIFQFSNQINRNQSENKHLWKELGQPAKNVKKEEYDAFLLSIKDDRIGKIVKSYLAKLSFYSKINKKTIIKNMEVTIGKKSAGDHR